MLSRAKKIPCSRHFIHCTVSHICLWHKRQQRAICSRGSVNFEKDHCQKIRRLQQKNFSDNPQVFGKHAIGYIERDWKAALFLALFTKKDCQRTNTENLRVSVGEMYLLIQLCIMGWSSFWCWFDINRSSFHENMRKNDFCIFVSSVQNLSFDFVCRPYMGRGSFCYLFDVNRSIHFSERYALKLFYIFVPSDLDQVTFDL